MAGATTTTLDALIRPQVREEISDAVFRNSDLLPNFRQEYSPGTTYDIKVIYDSNDSVQTYIEDQAVPNAGNQSIVTAAMPFKHFRVFTRLTGHARKEVGAQWDSSGWPGAYGGIDVETMKAKEDLVDKMNVTFVGTSTSGVDGIINDDTTAFYDLSRSIYTALKSYVKSSAGALTTSLLDRLLMSTYDATYGGQIEALMMAPTQARKLSQLVGGKIQITGAGDISGGTPWGMSSYGGARIIVVRDLAATVINGLSGMDRDWVYINNEPAPGGIDVLPYGVSGDALTVQYSTAGGLACFAPQRQGKLEGLGTT